MQTAELCDGQDFVQMAQDNFTALLNDTDFSQEMELMGIGRMQFLRRRQMLIEWRGLHMALWRLALARSFPQDAEAMFASFHQAYRQSHPDKISTRILERANEYWGMLLPKGDTDFSAVARHLASFYSQDEKQTRHMNIKLVLHIRNAYRTIFDRLI